MTDLRTTIVRLLSSMGSTKEIQQYLKRFSQLDAARFAVVKVGGAVLRDDLEALTSSLAFLQQVGLTPIVVHGAGPQLDAEMQGAGIEKVTIDGLRYTDAPVLAVVRRVMRQENLKLVEALQAEGVRATSIQSGIFETEFLDQARYGLVGKVTRVDTDGILAAIKVGSIPVNELIKTLQPYKIVFLTGTGGLFDGNDRVIDSINLSTEYEHLLAQPWIHGGMRVKIEQIKDLLDALPLSSSVSITRPSELAKELFTHKGSGTLVRRGERVLQAKRWDELDLPRLRELIDSAFGRKLLPDYFERTKLLRAYVSENYRAAVILTDDGGRPYLDKFAVLDDAQGEGLGRAVWQQMRAETPALYWRSRRHNPINAFYDSEADGSLKNGVWKCYWYGVDDFTTIRECVEQAMARTATLEEPA
ncbi:MAG: acetylglutamate kinase [Xanthomonadales bacterium]|nr:acetylglutamate kinase [Xanthomonadales bacterium]